MFSKYTLGLRQGMIILLTLVFLFGNLNSLVHADRGTEFDLKSAVLANQTPLAYSQSLTIEIEEAAEITLTGYDPDGDVLTFLVVTEPEHGFLEGTAPDLIYIPYMEFIGEDSFTFVVNDGTMDSEAATVAVAVTLPGVNHPPTAESQLVSTPIDEPVEIILNGSDPDGDDLRFWLQDFPKHGYLQGYAPNFVYVPYMDFVGEDTFTFVTNDWIANSEQAVVKISVYIPVNHRPTAGDQSIVTSEDMPINITLFGEDEDRDPLRYWVIQNPSHGYLTGTAPDFVYEPYDNFYGEDSFTYVTNDWLANSEEALISIKIIPVNDQPVAYNKYEITEEDVPLQVTLSATDVDGDELSYVIVTAPSHGELSGTAPNLVYSPDLDFNGEDSFTFKVNDGSLDSDKAIVSLNVKPIVDEPVLDDQIIVVEKWVYIPIVPKLPRLIQ